MARFFIQFRPISLGINHKDHKDRKVMKHTRQVWLYFVEDPKLAVA